MGCWRGREHAGQEECREGVAATSTCQEAGGMFTRMLMLLSSNKCAAAPPTPSSCNCCLFIAATRHLMAKAQRAHESAEAASNVTLMLLLLLLLLPLLLFAGMRYDLSSPLMAQPDCTVAGAASMTELHTGEAGWGAVARMVKALGLLRMGATETTCFSSSCWEAASTWSGPQYDVAHQHHLSLRSHGTSTPFSVAFTTNCSSRSTCSTPFPLSTSDGPVPEAKRSTSAAGESRVVAAASAVTIDDAGTAWLELRLTEVHMKGSWLRSGKEGTRPTALLAQTWESVRKRSHTPCCMPHSERQTSSQRACRHPPPLSPLSLSPKSTATAT
jgi:hypothetical protein